MVAQTAWERMTAEQRIIAAKIDIMQHPDFALLSSVLLMGKCEFRDGMPMKTAATNGLDVWFDREFMSRQERQETRWVVLHENWHKAWKHCVEYRHTRKYAPLDNIAADFVVNGMIDDLDPEQKFAKRPNGITIYLDQGNYKDWSFLQVLQDLLKRKAKKGQGKGTGPSKPGKTGTASADDVNFDEPQKFDEHEQEEFTEEEAKKIKEDIEEGIRQGKILVEKMQGSGKGGHAIDKLLQERNTNWRDPLRQFMEDICHGDDQSRYCPPNKHLLGEGFLMPTHFSESTGHIVVACDTSGSMTGVYPIIFSELKQICITAHPDRVTVLWWDSDVCGQQEFTKENYDAIGGLLKPAGGGGTRLSCIAAYLAEREIKPQAVVILTDGYVESSYELPDVPVLFGVVDNDCWQPSRGIVIRISSES